MAVSRRTVTVLFADIADWTPLGERRDPESLRQVMTRYFDAMGAVLESHGGTLEKFIGDAVLAVFGVPELHEDDALRAVRTAVAARAAAESVGGGVAVRVAVESGEVHAAGIPGQDLFVTGPALGEAAHLEQSARPGEI